MRTEYRSDFYLDGKRIRKTHKTKAEAQAAEAEARAKSLRKKIDHMRAELASVEAGASGPQKNQEPARKRSSC